jgi:hypothetical protein
MPLHGHLQLPLLPVGFMTASKRQEEKFREGIVTGILTI